ncbi:uncharacterized protein LOC143181389 [Calliopsis andreniformis]|uniref:uncharacterized protein LOC143181389 n=1 Tax=Calliopsis andreniformis TaxID=337506 RepID=UPI003FCD60CE
MQPYYLPVLAMNLYLILSLLFLGVNGETKTSLDDIERDNLRAEDKPETGNGRPDGPKFLTKPQISQQQYQTPRQYSGPTSSPVAYVTPSSGQNVPQEAYVQLNKYVPRQQVYQQQNNILPEQTLPPQYYNEYQQQSPLPVKGVVPNVYESQQLVYQPELVVGNQLQSVQQKTVGAKYGKNVNKDTVYVNIPMMQLLAYYPNLGLSSSRSGSLLVPQLAPAATEQIPIPVYTSNLNQKPIVPVKPTYQIQYTSKQSAVTPALGTKTLKSAVYTTPVTSKKYTSAPFVSVPAYTATDQAYAQGRQLLYTQAYIAPSRPQYVPQLVYTQPATVYMHATPVYSDIYARPTTYVQDNSLQGPLKYSPQAEQLVPATPVPEELPNQILAQQTSQSVEQEYVKDPEEPSEDLVPPQLPAQEFKSGVTPLAPVPPQEDEFISMQNHIGLSVPRSLLDSYVPSKVIAAQDSARYQERPITLESGFLPSKENFLHKKRKSN